MKSVLITGANKSIGFETARQLLQKGCYIYLGSRNLKNGLEAVERLKVEGLNEVEAIQLDVSNPESVKAARAEIGKKTEALDVLINNAGINGGIPWILRTIVYHLLRTKVYQLFRSKVYQSLRYILLDFAAKYTTRVQVSV